MLIAVTLSEEDAETPRPLDRVSGIEGAGEGEVSKEENTDMPDIVVVMLLPSERSTVVVTVVVEAGRVVVTRWSRKRQLVVMDKEGSMCRFPNHVPVSPLGVLTANGGDGAGGEPLPEGCESFCGGVTVAVPLFESEVPLGLFNDCAVDSAVSLVVAVKLEGGDGAKVKPV